MKISLLSVSESKNKGGCVKICIVLILVDWLNWVILVDALSEEFNIKHDLMSNSILI